MEELDYEAARLWSKERIREAIESRQEELREWEERVRSQGKHDFLGAEGGVWQFAEDYKVGMRGEIDYLLSLL